MSVLSFPRIYFKGYTEWDPCTFNNNDWQKFPTYDGFHAALNWDFLANENPPITPANFPTAFRPWAITLQDDRNKNDGPPGVRVPAEWNMFGTHAVSFLQYNDRVSTVTGGALAYGQPVTADPLIGAPVSILGDGGNGPGTLVDTNPFSFWSSQVYYGALQIGNPNQCVSGPRVVRMHSRWINMSRLYNATPELTEPAAAFACCFQACISNKDINWVNPAGAPSPLLAALRQASSQPGARGVMMRFTAYANLYFQNGVFNNATQTPKDYKELAAALAAVWAEWNSSGSTSQFFSQPCYSHVVGSVGVWNDGELASVPGGRYLAPLNAVTPVNGTGSISLGPVAAHVDYAQSLISLDFGSAMPEIALPKSSNSNLDKANFGALTLGTQADGVFTPIATIPYEQYAKPAYEAAAGIIDIPFPGSGTAQQLRSGLLAIQAGNSSPSQTATVSHGHAAVVTPAAAPVIALGEQAYIAQTDRRGIYLNRFETNTFHITVTVDGRPAPGAQVLIVKYNDFSSVNKPDGNSLGLIPSGGTQYVNFLTGQMQTIVVGGVSTDVTVVTANVSGDLTGIAAVTIEAQSPGFPVLGFFPFAAGQPLPAPPATLISQAGTLYQFYTTVRVLPFDSEVPAEFVKLWNSTHDPTAAWQFIYNNILYVYDMLFNVMLEHVNLGSQTAVEAAASTILTLISVKYEAESTNYMPITRDLSTGKRHALLLWIHLVVNGYKVPTLTVEMAQA